MKRRIDIRKEFSGDWLTREAGERLRGMILAAAGSGEVVELDFGGAVIASTSFFDEGIAKLAECGWTRRMLDERLAIVGIHPRDRDVLEELFARRNVTGT